MHTTLGSQQAPLFRTLGVVWKLHAQGTLSLTPSMILMPVPTHVTSLGPGQGVGRAFPSPKFGLLPVLVCQQDPYSRIPYLTITVGGVEWWFGPHPTPSPLGTHLGRPPIGIHLCSVYKHVPRHQPLLGNMPFGTGTGNQSSVIP